MLPGGRMNSNMAIHNKQKKAVKSLDIEALKDLFISENIHLSYPAAERLGEQMSKKPEAKIFILENIVNQENKHALRHSFASLPVYIAHLKTEKKEEKIKFLTDYGSIKVSGNEKRDAVSFFAEFLKELEKAGRWEYLENNKNLLLKDVVPEETIQAKIRAAVEEKTLLVEKEKQKPKPIIKKIQGILKGVDRLQKLDAGTITYKDIGDIGTDIIGKPVGKTLNRFGEWVIASIVYSFYHLYRAFSEEFDFFLILYYLIRQGRTRIAFVKSLPFFLDDLVENGDNPPWLPRIMNVIETGIFHNGIHIDQLHTGDFLKDFAFVEHKIAKTDKAKNKYLEYLGAILPDDFKQGDKNRDRLLFNVREIILVDEFKWRALTDRQRNLVLLYESLILNDDEKPHERKLGILYQDLMFAYGCNFELTQFFLRLLKKLFFDERESNIDNTGEALFYSCEKQIFMILKLLKKSDWKGTVEKDLATILIDNLDYYNEKYKPEGNDEYPVDKLLYYICFTLPSDNILRKMGEFAKQKNDKNSIYSRFLKHFKPEESFTGDSGYIFDSILLSKRAPQERDAELKLLKLENLGGLDQMCRHSLEWESRFLKLFKWKGLVDKALADTDRFFFKDYKRKKEYFEECTRECDIYSGKMYHKFSMIFSELRRLFIDIRLIYDEDTCGYKITYRELTLSSFMDLPEKIHSVLKYLNELEEFVTGNLPTAEKDLFLGGEKRNSGIMALQKFLRKERAELIEISRQMLDEDECYFENKLFETGSPGAANDTCSKGAIKEEYLKFIKEWFFRRFNFKILLKKKVKRKIDNKKEKADNQFLWNKDSKFSGRSLLNAISNPLIVFPLIIIPFLLNFFSGKYCGWAYTVVTHLFIAAAFFLLIMWIYKKGRPTGNHEELGCHDFFLPKFIAMIFIASMSIYYVEALWALTITNNLIYSAFVILSMLFVTYWILDLTVFTGIKFPSAPSRKRKRILHLISIGLIESFLLSLFNGIFMTGIMVHSSRADFQALLKHFQASASYQQPVLVYLFSHSYKIYPYIILVWTFQTFCIGIILQIFVQRDKVFD